ncbi:MAG TPA: hypothetical protein VGD36_16460 [Xanthobacteraceae bacterium]|jgi:L-lactate dehydrogenase complex protein LldG|nr:hypothetical protein [Albitalea sp.]
MAQPAKTGASGPVGNDPLDAERGRTPPPPRKAHDGDAPKPKHKLDRELDEALMESFPASDPPTPSQPTGTEPAGDPKHKP